MSIECTVCVSMPPGTRGTPPDGTGGGHTIHLKKAMAHFHWHADAYMLAIAASNILMYRHSYQFPQPGSVDTGVSHHPQVLQIILQGSCLQLSKCPNTCILCILRICS